MKKVLYIFLIIVMVTGCSNKKEEFNSNLDIYFFKAGKADSILISTPNHHLLIDTGLSSFGREIVSYLKEKRIETIDYLIISHFDKDHVGGAAYVLNNINVKKVYQSNYPKDSSEYNNYIKVLNDNGINAITLREDYSFILDNIEFKINAPKEEEYSKNPSNNSSLIVSIDNKNNSFLFMGDAQNERIKEFLNMDNNTYDVLKVPYHGHYQKELENLILSVKPKYAIITSSNSEKEDNKTIDLLKNSEVYLTRVNPIEIKSNGEKIIVNYK